MSPHEPKVLRLTLAAALLAAAAACQNSRHPEPPAPPAAAGAPTQAAAAAATPDANPSGGAAAANAPVHPRVNVCTLLSPAEVSAIMGRELIQEPGSCDYEMDPKKKEQQFAAAQGNFQAMASQAAAGAVGGMGGMGGMGGFGGSAKKGRHGAGSPAGTAPSSPSAPSPPGMPSAIMDQMKVSVEAARDNQTEDQIKDIYARTGNIVRGALAPDQHGLHGFIQGLDEIPRLGDWAFATNVASVNMGMGFSIRGRLLEARSGPWHLTVSATVSPDPGVPALDAQLSQVARALVAKLQ